MVAPKGAVTIVVAVSSGAVVGVNVAVGGDLVGLDTELGVAGGGAGVVDIAVGDATPTASVTAIVEEATT